MPLRVLFRWMLFAWLVSVFCLSVFLAKSVEDAKTSNLVTFLFSDLINRQPAPPLPADPLPAEPQAPPVAETPKPEPPAPNPEWIELSRGDKLLGKGTLEKPEVKVLDSGEVEVVFPCSGVLGDAFVFTPKNVSSLSIDVLGSWRKSIYLDRKIKGTLLSRLQIGTHPKCLRVTAISRDDKGRLQAKVERNADSSALRIRFVGQK